ncbi:MAG: ATPase [Bacteroidetes bacterium]|nr:MAG: ATPase [Bacteroidota bacterium]
MSVLVTKADGTQELFKVNKLRNSLRRAGATKQEVAAIVTEVDTSLYSGIKTQEIYRHAFELLRQSEEPAAARYSMRRALFNLGPTGFPFEDFLAKLFQAEGYTTQTRVTLEGKCASHELDVAAYKEDDSFVAEAKFHSRPGVKSDLQVALYTYARMIDLREQKICKADNCGIKDVLLVTNTKFTSTAIKYAECTGLSLLSWNYPKGNSLQDRVERSGIYPVTTLSALTQSQKRYLLDNGVVLCRELIQKPQFLKELGLSSKKVNTVLTQARQLCKATS